MILSKEICKKCRNQQGRRLPWDKPDDILWDNKGYVVCEFKQGGTSIELSRADETKMPWCRFILEHYVVQEHM